MTKLTTRQLIQMIDAGDIEVPADKPWIDVIRDYKLKEWDNAKEMDSERNKEAGCTAQRIRRAKGEENTS